MLALLMDKMVTWKIEEHFTASQALGFFEDMYAQLTLKQLNSRPPEEMSGRWDTYDRWANLPEDFVQKWSNREPNPSIMRILLCGLCKYSWAHWTIVWVRRVLHLVGK
jgi:hypothetical protein